MIKLIAGLGNPGPDYSKTRHNAGFWFLDQLARHYQASFASESRFHGEISRINTSGIDCRLLKPATFMNDSGRSVYAVMEYFRIDVDELMVVHDEIDLETGTVRLKKGGGHGGHNGIRDIMSHTGEGFIRMRIGVGHPGQRDRVTPHVLGKPASSEQESIDTAIERAIDAIPLVFDNQLQQAMNKLHTD